MKRHETTIFRVEEGSPASASLHLTLTDGQKVKHDDNSPVNFVNFVPNYFQKLSSVILSSLVVSEPSECAIACVEDENCNSVNFGTGVLDGGEHAGL